MERAQALLHGDLHTGSVLVTPNTTHVIDAEFATYGPMAFDVGKFMANLLLAFFACDGHATDDRPRCGTPRRPRSTPGPRSAPLPWPALSDCAAVSASLPTDVRLTCGCT